MRLIRIKKEHNPTVKAIALDWLEINGRIAPGKQTKLQANGQQVEITPGGFNPWLPLGANEPFTLGPFQFVSTPVRTRIFGVKYEVLYHGAVFADLYAMPHQNSFCAADMVKIRVHNSWLYSDWFPPLLEFMQTAKISLSSFGRVDIACDGYNILKPCEMLLTGRIEKVGRATWQPLLMGTGLEMKHFRIGSRKGDKYVKGYNKFNEIEQHSKKLYIFDYWLANGLPPSPEVERLEVSMKGKQLKAIAVGENIGINEMLEKLTDVHYLAQIAKTEFKQMYEFVQPGKEKVTHRKRVFEIVWKFGVHILQRAAINTASHIRSVQTSIKSLYQMAIVTGARYYMQVAEEFAVNADLSGWMSRRRERWRYEADLNKRKGKPYFRMWQYYKPGEQLTLHPATV